MRRSVLWRAATISGLIVLMGCMENLLAPRKGTRDASSSGGEAISALASGPSIARGPPSVVGAVTVTFGVACAPTMYTPPSVIDVGTDGTLAINADGTLSFTPPSDIDEAATVGFQYDFTDATGQVVTRTGVVTTTVGTAPPLPDAPVLSTLSYVPGSGADRTVFTPGSAMSIGPNGSLEVNGAGIPTVTPPDDFHSGGSLQYTLSDWDGLVTVGDLVVRGPGDPSRPIMFYSGRDGNWEIYVMNPDGTGQCNLTNHPDQDIQPEWSPDGQWIVFTRFHSVELEHRVYVMSSDGTEQTKLSEAGVYDYNPQWSPNGDRIAFGWQRDPLDYGIDVVNANGTGRVNLSDQQDDEPRWSPDGTQIAFVSARFVPPSAGHDIYVMNADGAGQATLSNQKAGVCFEHRWSPDGTRIAFRGGSGADGDIYVVNADGTGLTNLTNKPGGDYAPNWSPDGTKIAFHSTRDGGISQIYVMDADGGGQTRLTVNDAADEEPEWSPDGTRIAFRSHRDGNWEIYVMNADGTGQTNLTNNPGDDFAPRWRP